MISIDSVISNWPSRLELLFPKNSKYSWNCLCFFFWVFHPEFIWDVLRFLEIPLKRHSTKGRYKLVYKEVEMAHRTTTLIPKYTDHETAQHTGKAATPLKTWTSADGILLYMWWHVIVFIVFSYTLPFSISHAFISLLIDFWLVCSLTFLLCCF